MLLEKLICNLPDAHIQDIFLDESEGIIKVIIHMDNGSAICPHCQQKSFHLHSYYQHAVCDLPICGNPEQLLIHSRNHYCYNPDCNCRIFCDRLEDWVWRYARKTQKLRSLMLTVVKASGGGNPSVRLGNALQLKGSRNTFLRLLKSLPQKYWVLRTGPSGKGTPTVAYSWILNGTRS